MLYDVELRAEEGFFPSEKYQLEAVKEIPERLELINRPSEAVQLAAVERDGNCIQWINFPSLSVQLTAVGQNPLAVSHIWDPSEQVIELALKGNKYAVRDQIPNDRALEWIRKKPFCIQYVRKPNSKLRQAALRRNGFVLQFIKDGCTWKEKLMAVKKDFMAVQWVRELDSPLDPELVKILEPYTN